jgi:hypothetical protein
MHWVHPRSIGERMGESDAEQCEQNDPADPSDRHEGR